MCVYVCGCACKRAGEWKKRDGEKIMWQCDNVFPSSVSQNTSPVAFRHTGMLQWCSMPPRLLIICCPAVTCYFYSMPYAHSCERAPYIPGQGEWPNAQWLSVSGPRPSVVGDGSGTYSVDTSLSVGCLWICRTTVEKNLMIKKHKDEFWTVSAPHVGQSNAVSWFLCHSGEKPYSPKWIHNTISYISSVSHDGWSDRKHFVIPFLVFSVGRQKRCDNLQVLEWRKQAQVHSRKKVIMSLRDHDITEEDQ